MEFTCQRCSYHFKANERKDRCPYCGEKGAVSELQEAEDLVGTL